MLKHLRSAAGWAAVVLGLALLVVGCLQSSAYQECVTKGAEYGTGEKKYERPSSIFLPVQAICVGVFLNENGAALAAVGAFIVAGFTATLWWSTRELWRSGERSAKIASRGWTFIGPLIKSIKGRAGGKKVQFQIIIGQYGTTPSRVTEYCVQISQDEPTGDLPKYAESSVVKADFPMGPGDQFAVLEPFTVNDPTFVFGYVRYEDVFERPHRSRFCAKISSRQPKYVVAGGPAWNAFD
jgi:hypothetical protein